MATLKRIPRPVQIVSGSERQREALESYRFSAFWLRSSVVSVLISLISDTSSIRGPHIKWIFRTRSRKRGLPRSLHASTRYCSAAGTGALTAALVKGSKHHFVTVSTLSPADERQKLAWVSGGWLQELL